MKEVTYLSVILDIDSRKDLSPIADNFSEDIVTTYNDKWGSHFRASFQVAGSVAAANEDINLFCLYIESLEDEAMQVWNGAFSKVFDIGYEAGSIESCSTKLSKTTIQRISAIGASVEITIYPADSFS